MFCESTQIFLSLPTDFYCCLLYNLITLI
uniref:Uncharacterized protein n=1 Tax=Arundo donax TaxID=35708 RepID=A0A0A9B7X9_ARUDO